jgi:competence protein ComGC
MCKNGFYCLMMMVMMIVLMILVLIIPPGYAQSCSTGLQGALRVRLAAKDEVVDIFNIIQ